MLNTPSLDGEPAPHRPRAIVYVCTTQGGNPVPAQARCTAFAHRSGWDVVATLQDKTGMTDPDNVRHRPALTTALALVTDGEADVLLVPDESTISLIGREVQLFTQRLGYAGAVLRTPEPAAAPFTAP
jgi:hypothetical protein